MKPFGIPVRMGLGGPSRRPSYVMVTTRLSSAVVRYAKIVRSSANDGDAASPRRPASPWGATPSTRPTRRTRPSSIATTRVVSRSLTRALPSGRNVTPQGASSPVAAVPTTCGRPGLLGLGLVLGVGLGSDGLPVWVDG